jgi:YebC/PmpR family DNA-binding regulatory protein
MAGHSKWKQIKRQKAVVDAKRGALFTKLGRDITMAARAGGGDPNGNASLRLALLKAKESNMPADIVERAIAKAVGDTDASQLDEIVYEGYGPGGTAVMIEAVTDNRNRTVAEIRKIFSKNGGNLGESGCVAWMFQKKGLIVVDKDKIDEDGLLGIALEAGAEDVRPGDVMYEVITSVEDFEPVKQGLTTQGIEPSSSEISLIPQTTVRLEGNQARQLLKLMDELEDHDDVQNVYANFDIPDEVMAEV